MKILALNCKPDLSYFTKRGLNLEVEYGTINEIFPVRYLHNVVNQNGVSVPVFTPSIEPYLEQHYPDYKYSVIFVGWNPADYDSSLKNTGGYTNPIPLKSGTYSCSIRLGDNNYPVHELHHALCDILITKLKIYGNKDYMDIDKHGRPMYLNNQPENPESNYAQTWNEIKPYLPQLNAITYDNKPQVTITRLWDWGNETVGALNVDNFRCNTLERGWKNNARNISSIPKGTYNCHWRYSLKFGWCYEVQNVPNRSGILFHEGNFWFDTLGCIILGKGYGDLNKDGKPDILNSKETRKEFEDLMNKKDFTLTIK